MWLMSSFVAKDKLTSTPNTLRQIKKYCVMFLHRSQHSRLLAESEERRSVGTNKLDDQVFVHRNPGSPAVLLFHPLEPLLTVADKTNVT